MAESIVNHIQMSQCPVIHFCGSFHSDYGLGTVERVKRLAPDLKVLVIKLADEPGRTEPPFEGIDKDVADLYISLSN
ncbi:MAG: hypothetical protein U5N86_03720 [Planctomycetota bacterium]|nr:hypothetical protein [Planctomycetota bacterium]